MKVTSIDVFKVDIELAYPTRVPIGVLDAAHNVFLRINTDRGLSGWGEASPFAPITGDSQTSCLASASMLATMLVGRDPLAIDTHMGMLRRATAGRSSMLCAFDMALYDIAGQAANLPVYALLGGENRPLRSDFTIGLQDSVEAVIARLDEGLETGFEAVKLKVGRPGVEDVGLVAAVRDRVGADALIRIDANQGWDYPTALANLRAMESLQLQYCEQPLPASDRTDLKRLRDNTVVPICADESAFDDYDALQIVAGEAADYLNIKLGKSGGIAAGTRINAIAEAAGRQCMIGCFAESRLGLTAAAHLASARPNIGFVDLDSAYGFKTDPVVGGGSFRRADGGVIRLDDTPGLGARLSDEYIGPSHWETIQ